MTTTDNWTESDAAGTRHQHISKRWLLVFHEELGGWQLFGPGGTGAVCVDQGGSPALNLLMSSRFADAYIERDDRSRRGQSVITDRRLT